MPAVKKAVAKVATKKAAVKTSKVKIASPFDGGTPVAKAAKPGKEPKAAKFPKSLGACVDLYKALQEKRLAAQKLIEPLAKQEALLKAHIIDQLPKSQLGGVAGQNYRGEIKKKQIPQVKDWGKLQAYIKKSGKFELLGRSINAAAVAELWDAKKKVPGVEAFEAISLSVTKL
jgi:hypothetical protein